MNYLDAYKSLEELKKNIEESIKDLPEERLAFKKNESTWSVLEILEHIRVAEKQTLNAIKKYTINVQDNSEPSWLQPYKLCLLVLLFRLRVPFKAPKNVSEFRHPLDLQSILTKWEENRKEWYKALEKLPQNSSSVVFVHPTIGPLNLEMTLKFMTEHLNKHATQIKKATQ